MKTYQEFVVEAQKCWPGYKKKGTQKLFGKTYNRCVKADYEPEGDYVEEGKVEWDNPKKPLQSGLTPREKNRAKRISLGVENPNKTSFHGKPWDISDKDYERYGKLKIAHDDEKGKKTPRGKRHKFGLFKVGSLTSVAPKGEIRRQQKGHKNLPGNPKLWKQDERQKVYHQNDLKEPKESFNYVEEDWSNEYKRSIDCNNPKGFSQKAHCAGRTKRKEGGKTKSKSPFQEMYEIELEESSTGERTRGRATLARGRGADMTKSERTTAAVAKKAGLKGTGKFSTKDLRKKGRDYTTYDSDDEEDDIGSTEQDHFIRTYSSPRRAAKGERLVSKLKPAGRTPSGMTKLKTAPSSESVRRVKDLKKQMTKSGANKRGRVHTVDIMHRDSNLGKNDPHQQMERGRNFIQALKDTPHHLKKAGAKKGETVVGKPTAVMPGEDKKKGEAKRARLYKNVFGKKSTEASKKTGLMTGKVD